MALIEMSQGYAVIIAAWSHSKTLSSMVKEYRLTTSFGSRKGPIQFSLIKGNYV